MKHPGEPLRGPALQLEAAQDPLGACPGFPHRSHRRRIAATMQLWQWAEPWAAINFSVRRRMCYLPQLVQ